MAWRGRAGEGGGGIAGGEVATCAGMAAAVRVRACVGSRERNARVQLSRASRTRIFPSPPNRHKQQHLGPYPFHHNHRSAPTELGSPPGGPDTGMERTVTARRLHKEYGEVHVCACATALVLLSRCCSRAAVRPGTSDGRMQKPTKLSEPVRSMAAAG